MNRQWNERLPVGSHTKSVFEDDSSNMSMTYGHDTNKDAPEGDEELETRLSLNFAGENIDSAICQKLNKLTREERNKGTYDLHGVADDAFKEVTIETIQTKMLEMTARIPHSPCFANADTAAYQNALQIDKDYVEKMNSICLRARQYNSQKAGDNVIQLFSLKQELFGEEKLCKNIAMDDLHEDGIKSLQEGRVQLL